MIEIYLKYDNMHTFRIINAFICINNHVNSCINGMVSVFISIIVGDPFTSLSMGKTPNQTLKLKPLVGGRGLYAKP